MSEGDAQGEELLIEPQLAPVAPPPPEAPPAPDHTWKEVKVRNNEILQKCRFAVMRDALVYVGKAANELKEQTVNDNLHGISNFTTI